MIVSTGRLHPKSGRGCTPLGARAAGQSAEQKCAFSLAVLGCYKPSNE